jgi:hypothetical protein
MTALAAAVTVASTRRRRRKENWSNRRKRLKASCEYCALNRLNLPAHVPRQMRAVSSADVEALISLEPSTDVPNLNQAFVVLRINHEHAGGCDHDMVDVSSRMRDATVVQELDVWHAGECLGQLLLASSTTHPPAGRLRFVGDRQDDTAQDVSEPALDLNLSSRLPPLIFAVR